jgi:hypothetical protein
MQHTITMPNTFHIGDTAKCEIDGEPAQVKWRDTFTLNFDQDDKPGVPDALRHTWASILSVRDDGELLHFAIGRSPKAAFPDYRYLPALTPAQKAVGDAWLSCEAPLSMANEIIAQIPGDPTVTLQEAIDASEYLQAMRDRHAGVAKLLKIALHVEGDEWAHVGIYSGYRFTKADIKEAEPLISTLGETSVIFGALHLAKQRDQHGHDIGYKGGIYVY